MGEAGRRKEEGMKERRGIGRIQLTSLISICLLVNSATGKLFTPPEDSAWSSTGPSRRLRSPDEAGPEP